MQQDFYRIRPATVADALAMAQVKQITWEATYRGIYPDAKLDNYSIPENVQKFEKIINAPDVDVWVAECNHEGQLFEKAREIIKLHGYDEFFVSCNKYNLPAQQFYLAMGGVLVQTDPDNNDRSIPQVKFVYMIDD